MANIGGVHDRQGAHLVPTGGWCVDTIALSDNPAPTDYTALRGDINWIARLNNAYGSGGTIPLPTDYAKFAAACANYVAKSNGAKFWIIGNEPNHEQERPNGVYITPEQYARCFALCRNAIKQADPSAQVIPAPCAPYHADPMNWLDYWREMLTLIAANGGCDGIAVHAYTRSSNPADITSEAKMGGTLAGQYSGFNTYRDALFAVPAALEHLPVYISEFNELLPDGWHDDNTGVVQEAFEEINDWNRNQQNQQIRALVLYRFPKFDKWHIDGKAGVIEDFRAACAKGFASSATTASAPQEPTYMPVVGTGPRPEAVPSTARPTSPQLPQREWDERLTQRGVTVIPAQGGAAWRVVKARWFNEQAAGGRHHIYVEALNEQGQSLIGIPFRVMWPGGSADYATNGRAGFDAGNFPMSKSLNEFEVMMHPLLSDRVMGIGMGADGNPSIHTSTALTFQRTLVPATQPTPQPTAPTAPPQGELTPSPVEGQQGTRLIQAAQGVITQRWGDNPQNYARFNIPGHNGLDIANSAGTPILSVADGTVAFVGTDKSYGIYVRISHPQLGFDSFYAHLQAAMVTAGERVAQGKQIGAMGTTGNSTGNHLHLEFRLSDGNSYINLSGGYGKGRFDPAIAYYFLNGEK